MKLMRRVQMDLFALPTRPPELISSERQKAIALLQALLMEAATNQDAVPASNREPTHLAALTMHAAAFVFTLELIGKTRHMSEREAAVDAITAACDIIPRLDAVKFTGARSPEHAGINRVYVGGVHGALGRDLQEWRPPQVADYARISGSGRCAPGRTREGALADIAVLLKDLELRIYLLTILETCETA